MGTGPGLRSVPHTLRTLSVMPSAQPIKPFVPLQSCLLLLTLVIGNENNVCGFPRWQTRTVFSSPSAVGHVELFDVSLISSIKEKKK